MAVKTEKELYSKICVAESIKFGDRNKTSEENIKLTEIDKFSCKLATILARDKEVVAVNLSILSSKCEVYISKNGEWLEKDVEYISKIQEYLKNISKVAPMPLEEALKREDAKALFTNVMTYCSTKLESRFKKLKRDIINGQHDQYIKSFIEYASIDINEIDKVKRFYMSNICYEYYTKIEDSINSDIFYYRRYYEKFLKHLQKMGSYMGFFMNITKYAHKKKYKLLFSHIELHILESIRFYQPIFSWKNIIQKFITNSKEYEDFKNKCLNYYFIAKKTKQIYGDDLDNENIKHIFLHAEMNILTNIINQKNKKKAFIAVSKKCCYLCKLYIEFAQSKGYNIIISEIHKKIYQEWKLPDIMDITLKNNSLLYILENLDQIIIKYYTSIFNNNNDNSNHQKFWTKFRELSCVPWEIYHSDEREESEDDINLGVSGNRDIQGYL